MDGGAKSCVLVSECANLLEGMTLGDFKKTAVNGALLGAYLLPAGATGKGLLKAQQTHSFSKAILLSQIALNISN